MTAYTPLARARRRPGRAAAAAVMLAVAAACSPTEVLEVRDPDIIDPADVQSIPGAHAVRIGALARFNAATSGSESLLLLGGLFADEWINGDSFIARQEIDQRTVTRENTFLTGANRALHRARFSAEQALDLLAEFDPEAPAWQIGEMHLINGYVRNILAEHYCDGLVFSTVVDARPEYGSPQTTEETFEEALGHVNQGLALTYSTATADTANTNRVRNSLRILRGRILLNLGRYAEADDSVAAVPTNFAYVMQHSASISTNQFWAFNNNAGRYSMGASEGGNGLNFGTANDPRVRVCDAQSSSCQFRVGTRRQRDDQSRPLLVQGIWPDRESDVRLITGAEARLIEAEAALAADDPGEALAILNALRTTVPGLTPLTDAGTPEARVDQLFRERAFWLFGLGTRVGDLRRLIRQYGRTQDEVFPVGDWHKGGQYGTDVNFPIPFAEANNPNAGSCLNRDP